MLSFALVQLLDDLVDDCPLDSLVVVLSFHPLQIHECFTCSKFKL